MNHATLSATELPRGDNATRREGAKVRRIPDILILNAMSMYAIVSDSFQKLIIYAINKQY